MKNHQLRPLYVALAVVALILGLRALLVPADFGIQERGYMYGWHRLGNEAEWRKVSLKYRPPDHCRDCHPEKYADLQPSPHAPIGCQNCHGPALGHPDDPKTLTIDRSRSLCIRCHCRLPYPAGGRNRIRGIDPATHYPQAECVLCHYPHDPRREARR